MFISFLGSGRRSRSSACSSSGFFDFADALLQLGDPDCPRPNDAADPVVGAKSIEIGRPQHCDGGRLVAIECFDPIVTALPAAVDDRSRRRPVIPDRTVDVAVGGIPAARDERERRLQDGRSWPSLAVAVADIPFAGFADQGHLTKVFARLTGMTPAALRPEWLTSVPRPGRGSEGS